MNLQRPENHTHAEPEVTNALLEIARRVAMQRGIERGPLANEALGAGGMGFDSIGVLTLLVEVEKALGIEFRDDQWDGRWFSTIVELSQHVIVLLHDTQESAETSQ